MPVPSKKKLLKFLDSKLLETSQLDEILLVEDNQVIIHYQKDPDDELEEEDDEEDDIEDDDFDDFDDEEWDIEEGDLEDDE